MNFSQSVVTLKPRTRKMFQYLLESPNMISTKNLAAYYGLNVRTIRYDLKEIEYVCRQMPVKMIRDPKSGIRIEASAIDKKQILKWLSDPDNSSENGDAEGRLYKLLSILLTSDEPVVVKQLEHVLQASPRTIYADMDKAEV